MTSVGVGATETLKQGPKSRRLTLPRRLLMALFGSLSVGLAMRIWVLRLPIGRYDSDEATVGLMIRDMWKGKFSVFFWGQAYGGTGEPIVGALFRPVAGDDLALKLAPITLSLVACVLLLRICKDLGLGEPASWASASVMAVFPPAYVWFATKARGFYWIMLCLVLICIILAARFKKEPTTKNGAVLCLSLGLAFWTSPQIVFVLTAVVGWLLPEFWAKRKEFQFVATCGIAAILGAMPWIAFNLRHKLVSLRQPPPLVETTYLGRIRIYYEELLPGSLGLRRPYGEWILNGRAAFALVILAIGWGVVLGIRKGGLARVLAISFLAFPFLSSVSKAVFYSLEPRYGLLAFPLILILVVPVVVKNWTTAILGVCALATSTVFGISEFNSRATTIPQLADVTPASLDPLLAELDANGESKIYADYWVAYRLTLATQERISAAPFLGPDRKISYRRAAESDREATFVFREIQTETVAKFLTRLDSTEIAYRVVNLEHFVVVYTDEQLSLSQFKSIL